MRCAFEQPLSDVTVSCNPVFPSTENSGRENLSRYEQFPTAIGDREDSELCPNRDKTCTKQFFSGLSIHSHRPVLMTFFSSTGVSLQCVYSFSPHTGPVNQKTVGFSKFFGWRPFPSQSRPVPGAFLRQRLALANSVR